MDGSWSNRTGVAGRLLEAVLALPVTIDSVGASQLELGGATSFLRTTTIVELTGAGERGSGEDVAYSTNTQAKLPAAFSARDDLVGTWTIGSLAEHLDGHPLHVPGGDEWDDKPGFHRWAIESAALDLALRQHGSDLASLCGVGWAPVRVALSMGVGEPPSTRQLERWLEREPSLLFKLDASRHWDHPFVAELAARCGAAVATVDFKALYRGDWADTDFPPVLYDAVGDGLPSALLEDAKFDADTLDALDESALMRLSWDYPITAPEDIPGVDGSTASFSQLRPAAINIKPSRFGSLERLLATIVRCDDEGIPCYAGGQFELGIGRTHVQSIASLCFPDAPNDCAPALLHGADPATPDLPLGDVDVPAAGIGFGWQAPTGARVVD